MDLNDEQIQSMIDTLDRIDTVLSDLRFAAILRQEEPDASLTSQGISEIRWFLASLFQAPS